MSQTALHSVAMADNEIIPSTSSGHWQNVTQNTSLIYDCVKVTFSKMEYLPWDNSENIVSKEVEKIVSRVKNNLIVLLFLIGGPANVINMAVFYKQGLKDRVNLCLFALSLADGLYLLMIMLMHGEQLHLQFTTKERYGPMEIFIANHNLLLFGGVCFVSPVLSAIIAIERCLCVFNPLKFQSLLRTRTMAVVIVGVYILVLALSSISVLRFRIGCVHDPESGIVITTFIEGELYKAYREFIDPLDIFLFGFGLPITAMVVVTTMTLLTIVKLRQIVTWRTGTTSSLSPREVALTKMLVGNSILFIACNFPIALLRLTWLFMPELKSGRRNHNLYVTALWVSELFAVINSTFNIFVYYIMGSRYRETFWSLFSRKLKPQKPEK